MLSVPATTLSLEIEASLRNTKLLKRLSNDTFAQQLPDFAKADTSLGRMTPSTLLRGVSDALPLNLRFVVEQCICKLNGSVKIQPIDDFSPSGIITCCRLLVRYQ